MAPRGPRRFVHSHNSVDAARVSLADYFVANFGVVIRHDNYFVSDFLSGANVPKSENERDHEQQKSANSHG
jgi:hypothetical protein